jgi:tetratricopeptide (TPR) repeat protein
MLDSDEPAEIAALRMMLNAAQAQGNKSQEATALAQIAAAQEKAGLLDEAVDTYEDALRAYETLSDRDNLLITLNSMAQVNIKADNLQGALMYAQRGADFAGQSNMPERQIDLLGTLGDAQQQQGESKAAANTYRQALDLARTGDDKGRQATMLLKLGYAHLDDNDAQAAITNWEIALTLFRELDERAGEGKALGGMGTAYGEMNRWEESLNFHRSALHIAREVKEPEEEALQLNNLGYAAVQTGKLGDGLMSYRQALHLAYQADNRDNITSAIVDVASLLVRSPRHLSIAELLVDDAMTRDPADRDIQRLKERIEAEKISAEENGIEQNPVNGTAQDYAELAYQALDE